ncbi:MAG: DUF427 domain-containing protein [Kangiellaceae bacterium]|nr:DUF427 domain-containing protein [Kangiellaceae bacterium]MCW8997318.1 DUF427 domain-containing protein [Kangiellaceae bacterium]MCW9016898.1 DUF427 domain-containing protein [Kangiellaceae bacterium]
MKAVWKNTIIAESDDTVVVESNHYFPRESIKQDFFKSSSTTTHCPWKGDASYFNVVVNGEINPDAAWYYSVPKDAAKQIKDRVAFWKGIKVIE